MTSKRAGLVVAVVMLLSAIGVAAAFALSSGHGSRSNNAASYGSMMGGSTAPGWMMGGAHDPGKVMGAALADAPGPRVAAAQATRFGNDIPANAAIDRAARRITFNGTDVRLAMLASPSGGPDETFRIAGMVNPTVVVAQGTRVEIQFVNADPDTAHGVVVVRVGAASAWMPMMLTTSAFSGAAVWALGNPSAAGMHTDTLTFTATSNGTYQYLCPVPGHAEKGMVGTLIVT